MQGKVEFKVHCAKVKTLNFKMAFPNSMQMRFSTTNIIFFLKLYVTKTA